MNGGGRAKAGVAGASRGYTHSRLYPLYLLVMLARLTASAMSASRLLSLAAGRFLRHMGQVEAVSNQGSRQLTWLGVGSGLGSGLVLVLVLGLGLGLGLGLPRAHLLLA